MRRPTYWSLGYVEVHVKHLATADSTPSAMQDSVETQIGTKVADG
jgi:hypothetical protein